MNKLRENLKQRIASRTRPVLVFFGLVSVVSESSFLSSVVADVKSTSQTGVYDMFFIGVFQTVRIIATKGDLLSVSLSSSTLKRIKIRGVLDG